MSENDAAPKQAIEGGATKPAARAEGSQPEAQPVLEVRGLVKRFGNNAVLDGVDLAVRKGEVVVVLGPSGCGKSTLLRSIVGLEDIQGGEVLVAGQRVSGAERSSEARQKVGMVFQSYDLFPNKTVIGNLTLAPTVVQHRDIDEVEAEALALLKRVGLAEKWNAYPSTLSGGQRQRVAICRALLMHPEVMLFDEVTAALDPEMVREVLDVIYELADEGLTMVIVTHEMRFARAIADHVVLLDRGHVVEESGEVEGFFEEPKTERAREFLKTFEFRRRCSAEAPDVADAEAGSDGAGGRMPGGSE